MKYQVVAIMGAAGSGKDTIMQGVLAKLPYLHEMVSCTTRPPREGEKNGVNYFFLTPEEFGDKVLNNEMLECTVFNDWFYGTSYDSLRLDCINIGVFNPAGIEFLAARDNIDLTVFYVRASDKTRLLRQLNREQDPDVHEIIRRFNADFLDFDDEAFTFQYEQVINEKKEDLNKSVNEIADYISSHLPALGQDLIKNQT